MPMTYKEALETLGPRVSELRNADKEKDYWKAFDTAIAEVGGITYEPPNETRTKLGYEMVSRMTRPPLSLGGDESWGGSD